MKGDVSSLPAPMTPGTQHDVFCGQGAKMTNSRIQYTAVVVVVGGGGGVVVVVCGVFALLV